MNAGRCRVLLLTLLCIALNYAARQHIETPVCIKMEIREHRSKNHTNSDFLDCSKYLLTSYKVLRVQNNFTEDQINFIRSLDREGMSIFYSKERTKRQVNFRYRRECRTLGDADRSNLFYAFRRLKFDPGNEYDTLARIHTLPQVVQNAHDGSSFLGWHRVYLFMFENALRRKVPGVVLCYWDSTLDYLIPGTGQLQSIAFSGDMFGNGRGTVTTGPFAFWPTPLGFPLRRMIGTRGGSLVRPHIIDQISSDPNVRSNAQLTNGVGATGFTDSLSGFRASLEGEHSNVHVWAGEIMSNIPNSAFDPLFFFHHCYIDYVWQLFRRKQMNLGIDVERNYHGNGGPAHAPGARLQGLFPLWRNIHGYSNIFDQRIYRYVFHPVCGNGCSGSTRFLYCPRGGSVNTRCVSRVMTGGDPMGSMAPFSRGVLNGQNFRSNFADPRL